MAKGDKGQGDRLRRDLATLVGQLIEEGHTRLDRGPIGPLIREHLGGASSYDDLPIYTEELDGWELPNLQLALNDVAGRPEWGVRVLGLGGQARHHGDFGIGSLLTATHFTLGPPEFVNVATGPGKTLACIELAVFLLSTPAGPVALLVNRSHEHHGGPPLTVQATSPSEGCARRSSWLTSASGTSSGLHGTGTRWSHRAATCRAACSSGARRVRGRRTRSGTSRAGSKA